MAGPQSRGPPHSARPRLSDPAAPAPCRGPHSVPGDHHLLRGGCHGLHVDLHRAGLRPVPPAGAPAHPVGAGADSGAPSGAGLLPLPVLGHGAGPHLHYPPPHLPGGLQTLLHHPRRRLQGAHSQQLVSAAIHHPGSDQSFLQQGDRDCPVSQSVYPDDKSVSGPAALAKSDQTYRSHQ